MGRRPSRRHSGHMLCMLADNVSEGTCRQTNRSETCGVVETLGAKSNAECDPGSDCANIYPTNYPCRGVESATAKKIETRENSDRSSLSWYIGAETILECVPWEYAITIDRALRSTIYTYVTLVHCVLSGSAPSSASTQSHHSAMERRVPAPCAS